MQDSTAGGPSEGSDGPLDDPQDGARSRVPGRRVRTAVALVLVAAFGVAATVALRPEEEPPPVTTTTSTTTTSAPTTAPTTTIETLPAGTVEVATAKPSVTRLRVEAAPPTGWARAPLSVRTTPAPIPAPTGDGGASRPALPRPDLPIVGRFAVDGAWEFDNPGPYEPRQPFTMLVHERRGDWLEVHLPVRPNHARGWVRAADVDVSRVQHRIEIHLGERVLRAFDGDRVIAETPVVVGAPGSLTPTGLFYLTDKVPQRNPAGAYGPVALATDGYSEMMDQFDTGVPVIALHGTNRPELLGQDRSNGCVRMPNEVVQQLADTLPLGTPVIISP